jgi:predicted nucleotide-binding protein (sugar kinase/HSP70/actin superfamily)
MPRLKDVKYLNPYFGLHKKKGFMQRAAEYFLLHFDVPKKDTNKAVRAAYAAYEQYRLDIIQQGRKYIEYARENNRRIIVVAGRPYHVDPEINHGLDELIGSFGLTIVTEDAVAGDVTKQARSVLNQWTYHARMYNAARYVSEHDDTELVQLVSFGCGTDAITTDEMREILERSGKLYTQLKIDEISNLGAARIRIRSLIAAMNLREKKETA